jgi:hypothetical protein
VQGLENALFILTSVMSHAKPDKAICDAGLKAQSIDSGLPFVYGRDDVKYVKCSDEHGVIEDPKGVLKINEKLRLVSGHCDPTCNVHDWYVGMRKGQVDAVADICTRQGILKTGEALRDVASKVRALLCVHWGCQWNSRKSCLSPTDVRANVPSAIAVSSVTRPNVGCSA